MAFKKLIAIGEGAPWFVQIVIPVLAWINFLTPDPIPVIDELTLALLSIGALKGLFKRVWG